jgi:hypothetical protein
MSRRISRGKRAHLLALCGAEVKAKHRRNAFRKRAARAWFAVTQLGRAMADGIAAGVVSVPFSRGTYVNIMPAPPLAPDSLAAAIVRFRNAKG